MAAILADNIFKCIFLNEEFCILIKMSLKFVPKGQINNDPALVQPIKCQAIILTGVGELIAEFHFRWGSWPHDWNLVKTNVVQFWLEWQNYVTIIYMSSQLSCPSMCKIMTWSDNFLCQSKTLLLNKVWIMSLYSLYEMGLQFDRFCMNSRFILNLV